MNRALLVLLFVTAIFAADDFCWKDSYGRGVGIPISDCPDGTVKDGLLCYPPCKNGYNGIGPVCWGTCVSGMKDTGAQCEKKSYGRGVGRPVHSCRDNEEKNGALCYPKCKAGFYGAGPVCWQRCGDGYHDDGALCRKNVHIYGKGCCCTVFGCCHNCKSGYKDDGCTCRKDAHIHAKGSYGRGAGRPMGCANDEELNGALCYPKAKPGYKGVGPVAWEECKGETIDFGAFCTKKSYGRTAGVPLVCKKGLEYQAGLCYPSCKAGFTPVGPVCWDRCPPKWAECGAGCARDSHQCAEKIVDMVTDTAMMIVNIAAMAVGANPATRTAQQVAKIAKTAKKGIEVTKKISEYALKISKAARERGDNITDEEALEQAEAIAGKTMGTFDAETIKSMDAFDLLVKAMELLEKIDPTGAVAAARAFTHRKCTMLKNL